MLSRYSAKMQEGRDCPLPLDAVKGEVTIAAPDVTNRACTAVLAPTVNPDDES